MQNIPSHALSIRMMFCAEKGKTLIGSDFSQQEPRILAHFSNDDTMINAYKAKKDLYATIASGVYNNNYEDNLEFDANGNLSIEGKNRRSSCKGLLLGVMYGMGADSIAENTHKTKEEAEKFLEDFYKSYPKVKQWIDTTESNALKTGYVEDIWGRRRRLPDLFLPKYTIKSTAKGQFNPLLKVSISNNISEAAYNKYSKMLDECRGRKQEQDIKNDAAKEGITISNNSGFISRSLRQCVNARIQGSAATMTKKAMIMVYHDKVMQDIGFKLLIPVHDELLGEVPLEYADIAKKRLSELMIESAKADCSVPMKCDADQFTSWYEDNVEGDIWERFLKSIDKGNSPIQAKQESRDFYCELSDEQFDKLSTKIVDYFSENNI